MNYLLAVMDGLIGGSAVGAVVSFASCFSFVVSFLGSSCCFYVQCLGVEKGRGRQPFAESAVSGLESW